MTLLCLCFFVCACNACKYDRHNSRYTGSSREELEMSTVILSDRSDSPINSLSIST